MMSQIYDVVSSMWMLSQMCGCCLKSSDTTVVSYLFSYFKRKRNHKT